MKKKIIKKLKLKAAKNGLIQKKEQAS